MKILVIEDELEICRFLELELMHEGYEVEIAHDGRSGLELAIDTEFDLILLDVMLPQLNGIEVLRRIRQKKDTPVLLLTARDSIIDKVNGLDAGANDYLTKPFHVEELLARIRAVIRTIAPNNRQRRVSNVLDLSLDEDTHTITRSNKVLNLTKKEYDLLVYFIANFNIILSREKLLNEVWGYDYLGDSNIVDVYISYLRTKINEGFDLHYIETVRGVGYILRGIKS